MARTFSLHFGSGVVAEEARVALEHHVPSIQLLEFTDGEAAGTRAIRFATYDHRGRFQRNPLILAEGDLQTVRAAIHANPTLHTLLRQLVD